MFYVLSYFCLSVPLFVCMVHSIYAVLASPFSHRKSWSALIFFTLNVRGLNSPVKRLKCLEYLKQETHLKSVDINRFQNKIYKVGAFSSAPNKTKGVLILVRRKLNLTLRASSSDSEERFCYVIVMLNRSQICLASEYTPNILNIDFFNAIKSTLLDFSDAILILGGDFNSLVDPEMDSTNPALAL